MDNRYVVQNTNKKIEEKWKQLSWKKTEYIVLQNIFWPNDYTKKHQRMPQEYGNNK